MAKPKNRVSKTCVVCSKSFEVIKSREHKATACSRECKYRQSKDRYAEARETLVCEGCGKEVVLPKSHAQRQKYCSRACADIHKPYNAPSGENHSAWKGGKTKHSDGYMYSRSSGHPFPSLGCYVFEHRLVVEEWMREECPDHPFLIEADGKKYLKRDIEVHHLNEVKDDNRRENLVACTSSAHHAFHHGLDANESEYWPATAKPDKRKSVRLKRTCPTCYSDFLVTPWEMETNSKVYCSRDCFKNRSMVK